jgi:hypothetical protein
MKEGVGIRRKSLCAKASQNYPVLEYRSIPPEGDASVKACRHVVSDEPSVVHRHTFMELVYVESGAGFHTLDDARTEMTAERDAPSRFLG